MSLFDRVFKPTGSPPPEALSAKEREGQVGKSSAAHEAARLLCAPSALGQLGDAEALKVVSYMVPQVFRRGDTLIAEGEKRDTGFLLLILQGEVTVETLTVSRRATRTVTVLGPGSIIGEMALLDGAARSASCVAETRVVCAALSRSALEKMINESPVAAAKLMSALSQRMAERLRDSGEKLRLYAQLVNTMQGEIDKALPE